MIRLKNLIMNLFGPDAREDDTLAPSSVMSLVVPRSRFAEAARALKRDYALLAAEWAADETPFGRGFGVYACFRREQEYLVVKTEAPVHDPVFPSLTKKFATAYRFERQIRSLMGLTPAGNPDDRPWIKHEDWPADAWPLRKSFPARQKLPRVPGEYRWVRADGEGIYEIPVGPVHAGIIEPGHFRFQAMGEDVINLEEKLGYVHKGIEKRFESLSWQDGARLAARVSGDTTVAHSLAYARAVEALSGTIPPDRAHWLRALFLERERIANHLGDLGAICNDVAFAVLLYQFHRLKEIVVRTNLRFFGHRFLMDRIVPGGVTVDIGEDGIAAIREELAVITREFERLVIIYDENSSVEDRVRDTGVLTPEQARDLGMVGIAARASGLNLDCRIHHPFPPYDRINVNVPVLISGDVHARAWVRVEEVRESLRLVREILRMLPSGRTIAPMAGVMPDRSGFAAVEGWRGEILTWVQSGPQGGINRCMVRDPSSVNWLGLEQCIHGNIVPDFPVCNKSFNQSYSGNDL
ncbi:MAG TPA: NADH-quinone oxidoreductase subunit C [Nitrospirota bacterium]|nr:NADH-quinone oxidoreductase subunit C [Nitrospirota bacterium]